LAVSESDFVAFEHEIRGKLDTTFKQFLQEINGGLARPELRSSLSHLEIEISLFIGLDVGYNGLRRSYYDLEESFEEFAPHLPKVVPFAFDYGDGAICVIRGKEESEVVYVPTVGSLNDADIEVEVIVVAPSFDVFVASLSQSPGTADGQSGLLIGSGWWKRWWWKRCATRMALNRRKSHTSPGL